MFLKFRNIDRKTPVLESLFNKVASTNTGVFLWLLQNFWDQLFYRTPPVAAFGQIGFSPRFISIRHINTPKRCLTVHVYMKRWLDVIFLWHINLKKNFLGAIIKMFRIFFKYLAWHIYAPISCFVKTSKVYLKDVFRICIYVYLKDVFRICIYGTYNRGILYVTYEHNCEIYGTKIFYIIYCITPAKHHSNIYFIQTDKIHMKEILRNTTVQDVT